MSDVENKVQLTTYISGDNWTIRTASGEDLAETLEGVAKHADRAVDALGKLKQIAVAKGVFTGDSTKATNGGAKEKSRAADTPPPVSGGSDDGVPSCKHGPMKDLRSKNYKSDFYCTLETDDWKAKCKPVKV